MKNKCIQGGSNRFSEEREMFFSLGPPFVSELAGSEWRSRRSGGTTMGPLGLPFSQQHRNFGWLWAVAKFRAACLYWCLKGDGYFGNKLPHNFVVLGKWSLGSWSPWYVLWNSCTLLFSWILMKMSIKVSEMPEVDTISYRPLLFQVPYGPWASSFRIFWELFRNAESQPSHGHICWIGICILMGFSHHLNAH